SAPVVFTISPSVWTRVEHDNAAIALTTGWYPIAKPFFSGGSAVEANAPGARATFSFTGSGVRWLGYRDRWSGIANVYLDGVLQRQVDTYSASAQAQAVVFSATGLP